MELLENFFGVLDDFNGQVGIKLVQKSLYVKIGGNLSQPGHLVEGKVRQPFQDFGMDDVCFRFGGDGHLGCIR